MATYSGAILGRVVTSEGFPSGAQGTYVPVNPLVASGPAVAGGPPPTLTPDTATTILAYFLAPVLTTTPYQADSPPLAGMDLLCLQVQGTASPPYWVAARVKTYGVDLTVTGCAAGDVGGVTVTATIAGQATQTTMSSASGSVPMPLPGPGTWTLTTSGAPAGYGVATASFAASAGGYVPGSHASATLHLPLAAGYHCGPCGLPVQQIKFVNQTYGTTGLLTYSSTNQAWVGSETLTINGVSKVAYYEVTGSPFDYYWGTSPTNLFAFASSSGTCAPAYSESCTTAAGTTFWGAGTATIVFSDP